MYGYLTEKLSPFTDVSQVYSPRELLIHEAVTLVYLYHIEDPYSCLLFYTRYEYRTAPVTTVRRETPIIPLSPILQYLPGTPGI